MDIKKESHKNKISGTKIIVLMIIVLSIFACFIYLSDQQTIKHSELIFTSVKSGNLEVSVNGYGELKSNRQKLITAQSPATVIELMMKSGQQVTADTIILKLENIDLVNEKETADLELKSEQSNLRELILNQKRGFIKEKSKSAELEAEYETIKYQRNAAESLVASGTVSKLDFVKLQLQEKQLKQRVVLQQESLQQLASLHKEAINIQNEKINLKELKVKSIDKKISDLTVKAGQSGVIQKLPLELGQTLAKGEQIALIGDDKNLLASIRIPQSKVHLVKVGFQVIIDTRQDEVKGTVSRIEPGVRDNYVTVEVKLPQNLPISARPELNVDALIIVHSIKDAIYIERPINVEDNASASLFKYDENSGTATKTTLLFGVSTGRFIEVKSGANLNDVFIISDLSTIKGDTIKIKN